MDASKRHSGAFAKVSHMSGGLSRDWNRSWIFGVNREIPEDATCDPMPGVAVILHVKTGARLRAVDYQG